MLQVRHLDSIRFGLNMVITSTQLTYPRYLKLSSILIVLQLGANSGIGKEIATYAAAKGAKLYMFCRSKERAEKAKQEIIEATSSKTVEVILIDLVRR